ncbi:hypothetical protein L1049_027716 [Liquidambar formosana]|uniref:Uncharacterized protein n=1 Tax=Liquidambar formosana TaxID=63359 RepID=A0AAP0RHV6_LIQFO
MVEATSSVRYILLKGLLIKEDLSCAFGIMYVPNDVIARKEVWVEFLFRRLLCLEACLLGVMEGIIFPSSGVQGREEGTLEVKFNVWLNHFTELNAKLQVSGGCVPFYHFIYPFKFDGRAVRNPGRDALKLHAKASPTLSS